MKSYQLQNTAIATTIALVIVAGGLALRFKIAGGQATHAASAPSMQLLRQSLRQSLRREATDSATVSSVSKESPIAKSDRPQSNNPKPSETPPLVAISVTPIPSKTAQSASPKPSHLPYAETDPARLQPVGTFTRENFERTESLDIEAASAFILMVETARAQGINLMPISGFRTVAEQADLFAKQTERYGSADAAAQLSAPAHFSEHHTGYAVDIGDSDRPETDLDATFIDTAAYQWLLDNAYIFGFEQSFPPDNLQGLSFEPWHWRYVQSERAAQILSTARAPLQGSAGSTATQQL